MKARCLTNKSRIAVMGLSLLLASTMCACSKDLPDRTQDDTTATTAAVSPSSSSTVTVTTTIDKTLPPDTASLTLSMPTTPAEPKEGQEPGHTPDEVVDMLVDQGAQEEQIVMGEDGDDTTIRVGNLSVRDAARAKREAELMGAKVTSIEYDVSDPSSIKREAISEAYQKSKEDADLLISAITEGMERGQAPVNISVRPIETVSQNESEVTVRVTMDATYSIE